MAEVIRVKGLYELQRAFRAAGGDLSKDLRRELRILATPVRVEAQALASREIRNIGRNWEGMRTGVSARVVYVAPKMRGTSVAARKRPNLAPLLLDRAMVPALERNRELVVVGIEQMLDRLIVRHGF